MFDVCGVGAPVINYVLCGQIFVFSLVCLCWNLEMLLEQCVTMPHKNH